MPTKPLIITCAIVGAELTREIYPHLPLTPAELATAAVEAVAAGASIIHLHVRDEQGKPTQRLEVFQEVTEQIRRRCDCILQYSTGGAVGTPLAERHQSLCLRPEMATLSMGSMNFGPEIYENSERTIETIAAAIRTENIMPELEIFDFGMLDTTERLLAKGTIPPRFHINFVLGVPGGMAATPQNLFLLTQSLKPGQTWTVSAIGRHQLPLTTLAMTMGGHIRLGLEDNIYYRKGQLALSNAQLIQRSVRIACELERPVATVAEARAMLGLA
ncbi:MAG: 3-keto-5-aminohexanoate cleavage protein [Desulfoprunum sp.]|nr:3-keto-5-aminohexanoate cleavage protein [Desulfoprunum sp.]